MNQFKFKPGDKAVLYSKYPYAVICRVMGYSSREGYIKVRAPEGVIAEVHQDQLEVPWYEKKDDESISRD